LETKTWLAARPDKDKDKDKDKWTRRAGDHHEMYSFGLGGATPGLVRRRDVDRVGMSVLSLLWAVTVNDL
jgi:hypothetical protein